MINLESQVIGIKESLSSLDVISHTLQEIRDQSLELMRQSHTHEQRLAHVEQYSTEHEKRAGIEFGKVWDTISQAMATPIGTSRQPQASVPPWATPPLPHLPMFGMGTPNPPMGSMGTPRDLRDKIKIPSYDGKRDTDSLEEWVSKFEKYFRIYPRDQAQMVLLATMHLEGSAATWWHSYEHDVWEGRARDILTWDELVWILRQTFHNVDYMRNIRREFSLLRQSGTIEEYNTKFRSFTYKVKDISPEELLFRYTNGLKTSIEVDVISLRPSTVEEAMQHAL